MAAREPTHPGVSGVDAIRTVWIDNPPLNVVTAAVAEAIGAELDGLGEDVRVVVLRGRGERAFSAGADLTAFAAERGPPAGIQQLADTLEALRVPVVAAIHGYCLGGGLELALACDVRVAEAGATLGFPESARGLVPGGGGTQRAPRLIGRGRAAWLIMSAERISSARAEAWGLVEFVVENLDAGVEEIAGKLARQSPYAMAQIKRLLRETREQRSDARELEAFAACLRSEDGREGIAAFIEKREPNWSGR
jgi:enoyl-CoA hydratase/carnithine racemase